MSTQSICSICGANYEYINGRWKCPACGAYKAEELSNEEVTLLYSAAQKLRFADFDESEKAYTDIIEKYPQNHNGYWGRLLSKYGIKYEEDFDGRKIPTCYAASIESVISDKDYNKAIELADEDTRAYYQRQADYIERVRKEWVEKAKKEKPYDIFICYKDSDLANGIERTQDSIAAQDIYIHLMEQGYRVFFSRESLRDKVGEKYEPYIFNALSTSKVMLVYGTSSEYITSTWLKNEWTRYEKRMSNGEKKRGSLIVACDGFSPNELPRILSSKQCFDAQRRTFFTDLDKCIKRLMQESSTSAPSNISASPDTSMRETVSSELHEHVYKTKIVKATCVAKGYTIHQCDCGYEYRDSYTPLVDHKFKIINEVSPTCTTQGRQEKVCEVCGDKQTDIIPALEHNYSKWVEIKRPTCTETGLKQRKCIRCGEVEENLLPITEHKFDGWSVNPDGTQTNFCTHCGIAKTELKSTTNTNASDSPWGMFIVCLFFGMFGLHKFLEIKFGMGILYLFTCGLFGVGWIVDCVKYFKIAINSTRVDSSELIGPTIRFKDILLNIPLYWRSFFTNETTRMQKIKHWVGLGFLWLIIAMLFMAATDFYVEAAAACALCITITMFVGIGAIIAGLMERIKYKKLGIPYPRNNYGRSWLKAVSGFLLFISSAGISGALTSEIDIPTFIAMSIIFIAWFLITTLYAHCPKQYKAIQFTSRSKPMKKWCLIVIGIFITWTALIVMGIVNSTIQ